MGVIFPVLLRMRATDRSAIVRRSNLMLELMRAGSKAYRFDSVLPWTPCSPSLLQTYRNLGDRHDRAVLIELVPRSWGAKDSYRWQFRDAHMAIYGHPSSPGNC